MKNRTITIIGASALSLAGVVAFAMTTNLRLVNQMPAPEQVAPASNNGAAANASAVQPSFATSASQKSSGKDTSEGLLQSVKVTAGAFDIHRKYRSMEGPYVSQEIRVGDMINTKDIVIPPHFVTFVEGGGVPSMGGGKPSMHGMLGSDSENSNEEVPVKISTAPKTLYWVKGIKLIVLDEQGKEMPTTEFICHLNVDMTERNKIFPEAKSINGRLFTLTQGQTEFHFPEGFGVPVSSKEKIQFSFQAANRTSNDHRRLKHVATIDFIKDSDLKKPMTALAWDAPYVAVILSKEAGNADMSHHGPNCLSTSLGQTAPNASPDSTMADSKKNKLNGHWVVPPGEHTYTSPIDDERNRGFNSEDRVVHAVWSHMHPLCTEMHLSMCDGTQKTEMWKVNAETDTSKGLRIKHIDNIYSTQGILLPAHKHYEIAGSYNNTTGTPQDSMLTFGIFYNDTAFKKPDWSKETPDNVPDRGPSHDYDGADKYALFNDITDGPLLKEVKNMDVVTSAGHLHFTFDPTLAPKHATHMYNLFRNGAYDGTPVFAYQPNFIFQVGSIDMKQDKRQRLADANKERIRRLPLETSCQMRGKGLNDKWALSMSRAGADDSATSSFSILLTPSHHLDEKFTVFGHLNQDKDSLDTIARMKAQWKPNNQTYIICATEEALAPDAAPKPSEELASAEKKDCKLYCGIKPTAQQLEYKRALENEPPPRFDLKKDGPLLTESKHMNIKTSAGDIHVVIDPKLASKNASQIYKLFKAGAYDGTSIPRFEKDFVIQIALAEVKESNSAPIPDNVREQIRRIPLEISTRPDGLHKRFVLSMAHEDADVNSGSSSFSILLGSAPHLDKHYSVFGHVVDDAESNKTIAKIQADWSKQHPHVISITEMLARIASTK